MDWQLEIVVRQEPYLDYTFPLEQMNGWNVSLVETLHRLAPVSQRTRMPRTTSRRWAR